MTNRLPRESEAMPAGQMNSPSPSPYLPTSASNSSSPEASPMVMTLILVPVAVRFQGTLDTFSPPLFRT